MIALNQQIMSEEDSAYIMENNTPIVCKDFIGANWNVYLTEGGTFVIAELFITAYNQLVQLHKNRNSGLGNYGRTIISTDFIKPRVMKMTYNATGAPATLDQVKTWLNRTPK